MLRNILIKKNINHKDQFKWRSNDVLRIEAFSDAVFAFSVTLIIVSLKVPKTFNDLMNTMNGLLAFAVGFAILCLRFGMINFKYFRRFGLQNLFIIILNGVLLFVVLSLCIL